MLSCSRAVGLLKLICPGSLTRRENAQRRSSHAAESETKTSGTSYEASSTSTKPNRSGVLIFQRFIGL